MSLIPFFRFAVGDAADFNVGVVWAGDDFTGASMVLTVYQQPADGGAALLTADTDSGRVRIRSDGAGFDYMIPQAVHAALPLGLLRVQQVMTRNGVSQVLFNGTWSRIPGAVNGAAGGTVTYDGFKAPIEFGDAAPVVMLNTTGAPGDSAYETWLQQGGVGSEADFLSSLKGPKGDQGEPGADGQAGAAGESAYEAWQAAGNVGTVADFLASLKGPQGPKGDQGTAGQDGLSAYQEWVAAGHTGTEADFLASLQGAAGPKGDPGDAAFPDGQTGQVLARTGTGPADVAWISVPGVVVVTGETGLGDTLTASTIGDSAPWVVNFQWTRDGAPIEGETAKTHVITEDDLGHALWCSATVMGISIPAPAPINIGDPTLSTTVFGTASPGAILAVIEGLDAGSTPAIADEDTSGLFAVSGVNLVAGLNYPETLSADETVSVDLTITNPEAANSPHTSTLQVTIKAPTIKPGNAAYRTWALFDPTSFPVQGTAAQYGYDTAPIAQWIHGQYIRETGRYLRGVAAWKGVTPGDLQAGDTRGIDHVDFFQDDGSVFTVSTPMVDPASGIEAFLVPGDVADVPASRTSEQRAVVYPKVGKPFVLQGRSAAGPPGQMPTYDTTAGPQLPTAGNSSNLTYQSFDARVWSAGAVNGGTYQTLSLMPGAPSMIVNLDTGDGLLPQLDMWVDPVNGRSTNDGLSPASPVQTFDDVYNRAPAKMAALFGVMKDPAGTPWNDVGGLRINLLSGNHTIGCSTAVAMLGCANQPVTVRVDPNTPRANVKITGEAPYAFLCEKIRLEQLDFVNASFRPVHPNGVRTTLYGDVQTYDCTWDGSSADPTAVGSPVLDTFAAGFAVGTQVYTGSAITMKVVGSTTYTGSGYTAQTTMTVSGGAGLTFTPIIQGGQIVGATASGTITTAYNNATAVVTFNDPGGGSGAVASLNLTQGSAVSMQSGGAGYTAQTVVNPPANGAGISFVPVIQNGAITSVIASGVASSNYRSGDPVTFTDPGGGQGAAGTINVYYQGQPTGAPAFDWGGAGAQIETRGRLEIIGKYGSTTPMFSQISYINMRGMTTLLSNVLVDSVSSAQDIIGECKAVFKVVLKNSKEFVNPMYPAFAQALFGTGNHPDFLQPFNPCDGAVIEDIDNSYNCNFQGIFADSNGPFRNCAFVRPKLRGGAPLTALTPFALGAGAQNVVIVDPDMGGGGSGYTTNKTHSNVRVVMSQWGDNLGGWETAFQPGVSFVYPESPVEPYDQAPASTPFDAAAPGLIIDVFDLYDPGFLRLVKYGSSGVQRERVGYVFDLKKPAAHVMAMADTGGASLDRRRPTYIANGLNGAPCLQHTGYNTTAITAGVPDDFALGGSSETAYVGTNPAEHWFYASNDHLTYLASGLTQDPTQRWFWDIGGVNAGGNVSLWRKSVNGKEQIGASLGYGQGATPTTYTSDQLIDTSSQAPTEDFSGLFFARVQALSNELILTVWNANHPDYGSGVVCQAALPANTSKYVVTFARYCIGARAIVSTGNLGTFAGQKWQTMVNALPMSDAQAQAMHAIFRARAGF